MKFSKLAIATLGSSLMALNWSITPDIFKSSFISSNLDGAAWAGTCVAGVDCPPPPVQFVPGQTIRVEISNLTDTLVYVEKVQGEPPLDIIPGQVLIFTTGGNSINNLSLLLWDNRGSILTLRPVKVNNTTLRVEIRAGVQPPGDRSVYLQDDGRILIL